MKIYADPITINCRKVLAGLDLMKAPYELAHVDYFKGEQKGDAYLAINPNASIPAMVDGDLVLWESNAILQYAADRNGGSSAYPTDLKTRADINRWLLWESSSWFPSCYVYLVENCVKPLLGGTATMETFVENAALPFARAVNATLAAAAVSDKSPALSKPAAQKFIQPRADGSIIIPPQSTCSYTVSGLCMDRALPAPVKGDALILTPIDGQVPEAMQPLMAAVAASACCTPT